MQPNDLPLSALPSVLRATVSSKGQITLPIELRRQLNLETGTHITFTVDKGAARLQAELPTRAYRGILSHLRGIDTTIPKEADRF